MFEIVNSKACDKFKNKELDIVTRKECFFMGMGHTEWECETDDNYLIVKYKAGIVVAGIGETVQDARNKENIILKNNNWLDIENKITFAEIMLAMKWECAIDDIWDE